MAAADSSCRTVVAPYYAAAAAFLIPFIGINLSRTRHTETHITVGGCIERTPGSLDRLRAAPTPLVSARSFEGKTNKG